MGELVILRKAVRVPTAAWPETTIAAPSGGWWRVMLLSLASVLLFVAVVEGPQYFPFFPLMWVAPALAVAVLVLLVRCISPINGLSQGCRDRVGAVAGRSCTTEASHRAGLAGGGPRKSAGRPSGHQSRDRHRGKPATARHRRSPARAFRRLRAAAGPLCSSDAWKRRDPVAPRCSDYRDAGAVGDLLSRSLWLRDGDARAGDLVQLRLGRRHHLSRRRRLLADQRDPSRVCPPRVAAAAAVSIRTARSAWCSRLQTLGADRSRACSHRRASAQSPRRCRTGP